ncbi:hypothetical protein DEU56DRAFT_918805 [Suillus clintonianus]|uniref:uncharacterized protein n=1 Tax=Suillus clintonianus TaxID=1904413 RepID=UPI001B873233|nr:uncharacterized protein DEU56DRAFT_918805 [Suillus clintonianus]KAG2118489.1 hypothetical protein DEU56DRAFT_918805 [Suillus clintonianus]
MLHSGDYKMQNFLHNTRFVHMKADGMVVGFEEADIVELSVTNATLGLATLLDRLRDKYIVINEETCDVVGSNEPQVLQFSTEGDGKYTIHIMDVNQVWVLNRDEDFTPITTAPAPPPSVRDHEKKYWMFVRVPL